VNSIREKAAMSEFCKEDTNHPDPATLADRIPEQPEILAITTPEGSSCQAFEKGSG
jgi:hypothetical protein